MSTEKKDYRLDSSPEERWHLPDPGPQTFKVRTEFRYSEYDPQSNVPEGQTRHAFSRSGSVTDSGTVPSQFSTQQDLSSHLFRAIAQFGDDVDLVVEVRRA